MADRKKVQRTKLVFKDLGDPKRIAAEKEDVKEILLGTMIGIATDIVERKGPDGVDVFTGLKGSFEAIPTDEEMSIVKSGLTFLPEAFQEPIVAQLSDEDNEGPVQFACEIWVIRATNPQGYSWQLRGLDDNLEKHDPLDKLRAIAEKNKTKALPAK